ANLTQEEVEDIIGNMVTGNTEVGITVTYNDTTGKLNFTVATPTDTNIGTNDLSLTENRILDLNGKVLLFSSGGYDMLTLGYGNVRKAEFSVPLNIPDDAYGVGWNGSTETATKNSI